MSQYRILSARLQNELNNLDQVVKAAETQADKAKRTTDADFLQAAALSLQNYYMGVERIFEEIAKQVDQSIPSGPSSHQELLEQMALEIPQHRPSVLSSVTRSQINEYRAFRHVVMHRYGFELYPERVKELVEQLATCHSSLVADIQDFCRFLLQLDEGL